MSLGFNLSEPQRSGFATDEDVSSYNSAARGTHNTSLRLRLSSLTLDELREELERQTEETHKRQEEVENATRETLKRIGCTYNLPGQYFLNHDSSEDPPTVSAHQPRMTPHLVCSLDTLKQKVVQRDRSCNEKEALGNTINNHQQLPDLQPNKISDQPGQDTFSPQRATMNLQAELHDLQMEKDVLSDLRLKDSNKHVDQTEKMLGMLKEVQNIKRSADQKLQETEYEAVERSIKGAYQTMQCSIEVLPSVLLLSVARTEDLITILDQEMAMLTDKLSSSKDSGVSLCAKLDLLKKLTERQTSLHQCQISELESTLSSCKDTVCSLEQKILETETHLFSTQRERERSLQQAKDLQSQLGRLKTCCEQEQLELREDAEVLRGQLEVAREQLFKAGEEKTCLQALLEQKAQEVKKFQKLLQEKEEELCFRQQQTQQHLVSLEDAQTQCQTLQTEQEGLQLKLNDREKMVNVLRLQMESSTQMTERHRHTIDSLQQENSFLISQLHQHKLEVQQLRAELVQQKSNLTSVESHRRQLQASVTELSQCVREETLKKEEVTTQLDLQHVQFISLTKEHEELQRLHSCKDDEHEGVVLKLQSQLSSAHDELDKIRRTLRTLQGVERNGLQVALDMQKEITARREQVDSLQGKIQHLEEEVEKLQQEKRHQKLESHRHLQEITLIREEKRQLAGELKALRSRDQQLKERISDLEAILHKMAESFANCQDFLQVREQEYFRLKLQHALDLKDLQGQNFSAPADPDSHIPSPPTAPLSSQIKKQQERSTCELRSLVRQLRGVISENHGPHTDENASGCGFHRRRSAPEKEHRTTFPDNSEQVQICSRLRRKTCSSEPHFPTAEPNEWLIRKGRCRSTPVKYTSFPPILSLGRKSPVHTLLTSDPIS